jgi:hypothetical protein
MRQSPWGCVGAVDGLAIRIVKPAATKKGKVHCKNPRKYFNRKGFFSMNLQAACDSKYRFMFTSCRTAGSTHDSLAFRITRFWERLKNGDLPLEYWLAMDDAYGISDSTICPWPGKSLPTWKDSFNFWLSSGRISIEQTFGIFVRRWGILQRALTCDYKNVPKLVLCLSRLHNVCVNRGAATPPPLSEEARKNPLSVLYLQDEVVEPLQGARRDLHASKGKKRAALTAALEKTGRLRSRLRTTDNHV